jgi:hypothetical protein
MQTGAPPVAERVQFVLNDQGRVALSNKLGPAVEKAEGQVVAVDGSSFDINVFRVGQIGGGSVMWNGERVSISRDQVLGYQVRRLDKGRTALVAASVTVGLLLVFFGKSLFIPGGGVEDPPSTLPGPHEQRRLPR